MRVSNFGVPHRRFSKSEMSIARHDHVPRHNSVDIAAFHRIVLLLKQCLPVWLLILFVV